MQRASGGPEETKHSLSPLPSQYEVNTEMLDVARSPTFDRNSSPVIFEEQKKAIRTKKSGLTCIEEVSRSSDSMINSQDTTSLLSCRRGKMRMSPRS